MRSWAKIVLSASVAAGFIFTQAVTADVNPATVKHIAGSTMGYKDGVVTEAKLRFPTGIAQGDQGELYVSDTANHRIRMIKDGTIITLAGTTIKKDQYKAPVGGYKDGVLKEAMFNEPAGIVIDKDGTLYIADSGNNAIRSIKNGEVTTVVKGLKSPTDIAIAPNGDLYISDTLNHRIISLTNEGTLQIVAGGDYEREGDMLVGAYKDGQGRNAQFNEPTGIDFDSNGNLFVADTGNQRIRKITPHGIVTTVAGSGSTKVTGTSYITGGSRNGEVRTAQFNFPQGLDVAEDGTIYIADTYNHIIRKIVNDEMVELVSGNGDSGKRSGIERQAKFSVPTDVLILNDGNVAVVDQMNHLIRSIDWLDIPDSVDSEKVDVLINENILPSKMESKVVNGRTVLPVRTVAEALGLELSWDELSKRTALTKKDIVSQFTVGRYDLIGTNEMKMDVAPYINDQGEMMVPLRFIAESFGMDVEYLKDKKLVIIR
jgi:hypothetical protein